MQHMGYVSQVSSLESLIFSHLSTRVGPACTFDGSRNFKFAKKNHELLVYNSGGIIAQILRSGLKLCLAYHIRGQFSGALRRRHLAFRDLSIVHACTFLLYIYSIASVNGSCTQSIRVVPVSPVRPSHLPRVRDPFSIRF